MTRRARWLLPLLLLVFLGLTVRRYLQEHDPDRALLTFRGATMGTTYEVKVVAAEPPAAARNRLQQSIEGRLAFVNGLMSTWDEGSELSRFNRHASDRPFRASPQTLEVFRVAREVSEKSDGAFDVTVGPLVNAWGFGPDGEPERFPSAEEVAELRPRVGYRLVSFDAAGQTLRKQNPATVCDLSAVAKGYAVDELARLLLDRGYEDFLVEVGGELRAHGRRQDGAWWHVAIEQPDAATRAVRDVVDLEDRAMATSGDYRNYIEKDGRRVSHLIDPRTGRPIEHRLASVSVAHERCDYADAWATALMVLGPEEGIAVAEREKLAAYFVVREAEGFASGATSAFEALRRPR